MVQPWRHTLLLFIIYCAFISLGLPDGMLGSAWPAMQPELGARYAYAGWISMIVSAGTIIASILSHRALGRFGTGRVAAASVAMTAAALAGFAFAPSFPWLLCAAVPLGLGAGAVDAGLNAFVAGRYASRHMNWLHGFWGVGAMGGPLLLSAMLARGAGWRPGYLIAACVQAALATALFLSLPLWRDSGRGPGRREPGAVGESGGLPKDERGWFYPLRLDGVKMTLLAFFCYCGIEATVGLWGASFLARTKGMEPGPAAGWVSGGYASLTAARFASGFLAHRIRNADLIRYGCLAIIAGTACLAFPRPFPLAGLLLIGAGCAPIFPCLLQETPRRFGSGNAAAIMGFQMAAAYIGTTFLPPAFGFIASAASLPLLPLFLLAYVAILFAASERLRRRGGGGASGG